MKFRWILILIAGTGGLFSSWPGAAPPPNVQAASSNTVTFMMTFANGSKVSERWDGSVSVTGGEIVSIEDWQFSRDDSITGNNSWKVQNRYEAIRGFPRVNYNEMSPAELPAPFYSPVGVFLTLRDGGSAHVAVRTAQGDFDFRAGDISGEPTEFLGGRALVAWTPTVSKLSTPDFEDDEAAITRLPDGSIAVSWVAYRERGDRVMMRVLQNGQWSPVEEISPRPGDIFRTSLASDAEGNIFAFWSEREGLRWHIWGREKREGQWRAPFKVSDEGTNTFHRAAAASDGTIFVTWQSFRGQPGQAQSDIFLKVLRKGSWGPEMKLSQSEANDWEPAVAAGPNGSAYVAWDTYDRGNYDIQFRAYEKGSLGELRNVTSSPRFQAHASVAVDLKGQPWLAWDESGTNWGKDQGYLITPPLATPLHQERTLRVAMWDGTAWQEPVASIAPFYPYQLYPNFENPIILFDGTGTLTMVFRHWTRNDAFRIGAPIGWENYLTRFDGTSWTRPTPVNHSRGSIEKRPALVRSGTGEIWAAWMTDNRPFTNLIPQNGEIYAASLGSASGVPGYGGDTLALMTEPFAEEVPIHPSEEEDIRRVREHTISAGNRTYKIYRGDMHRHTDVSQDFKYDGSLIEVYRYALDAAGFDYIVPTDHQLGFDHEFTWWQDEKLADLFHVAGTFTPMFGYERSLSFPNGHRNVIFAKRGTRPLPIPLDERRGQARAEKLYAYLHENDGISMPHSSGTMQGTDWFNNDPEVEPLIEIYQGYRASYEYMGAPLAASPQRLREQRSGFNPIGYYWDALRKGYKLGVQASSDHWSTHISYACIVAEEFTRESMFEALKKRHAYAATDNIVLDFQARADDGKTYIMGDIIKSQHAPKLTIKVIGTSKVKQLVIVKNEHIIYENRPNAEEFTIHFIDEDFEPGSNYYYARVVQVDNNVAWASPIWVE